jgi:hypothetical protein
MLSAEPTKGSSSPIKTKGRLEAFESPNKEKLFCSACGGYDEDTAAAAKAAALATGITRLINMGVK